MKIKDGWTKIAEEEIGVPFGHVPGHQYHDVEAAVMTRGEKIRVVILETWGSAQGYDEEHGRHKVVAIDTELSLAIQTARERAKEAEVCPEFLVQALSQVESDAIDALEQA